MFTEAYLEPSKTSMIKLFCKNNQNLVAIIYFCECSLIDVHLFFSKMRTLH